MLVGIDASRTTAARRTGTENYSLHLIRELLALAEDHYFRLYFSQAPAHDLLPGGAEWRIMPFPRLWTHIRLSWEMLMRPPDLLFVPSHVLPLIHPRHSVVTVHDLGYHYYPEAHTLFQNAYLHWSTRYNARTATRVLVDSEATRRDLIHYYQIPETKIAVVYPGRDETLAPISDPEALAAVRAHYGLTDAYLLYVGTLHPRKNLARLVQAFAQVLTSQSADSPPNNLQLVLAGQKGWLYDEIFAQVRRLGLADRVVFTGYVPDDDLPALLSGALAFVFPSLYEGFGLPVLEAMACGTPVIGADASCTPEVVGDAGLLVPPHDVAALADSLEHLLVDTNLQADLGQRGQARAAAYTWEKTAAATVASYRQALKGDKNWDTGEHR